MRRLGLLLAVCTVLFFPSMDQLQGAGGPGTVKTVVAKGICKGRWLNPLTDICWSCLFPVSLGSFSLYGMPGMRDIPNYLSPVCICPSKRPPWFRIGLAVGFWEPVRMSEAVRTPFCFPSMAGMLIDLGAVLPNWGTNDRKREGESSRTGFYQMHWFKYPVLYWLNNMVNTACDQQESFDIVWMTELDPLWANAELTFILQPEAALFANPVAVAACAADCVASTTWTPLDALFWCAGCHGVLYPFAGHQSSFKGGIQGSLLSTEKLIAKLARLTLTQVTSGPEAICGPVPTLVIKKSQYRTQLAYPIPQLGAGPFCCNPFGANENLWGAGREFPFFGEDFVHLIWRKRNCCLSY